MNGPGKSFVDSHLCVRHWAFKYDIYFFVFPLRRNKEFITIKSFFVMRGTVVPVVVTAETLQLPLRGYVNRCPITAVHTIRTEEIPFHGIVFVCSR